MITTGKHYRKKLIMYGIFVLILGFGIGLPTALWSIKIISGEDQPEKGKQVRAAAQVSKTIKFMPKRQ